MKELARCGFILLHLGDEVVGCGEGFFAAQALAEVQADFFAVEVVVPVEDVGFDAAVLVLEGRVIADIGHGRVAFAVPPQFGDVDAVRRDGHVDGDEHVGRSKADGPPPPVAGHDGAGQGKGAAQEVLCRFHVAHLDEAADDGAADRRRPARPFEEGQGNDGDAILTHEEFHRFRIAGGLGSIGKVRSDNDGRRMDISQ